MREHNELDVSGLPTYAYGNRSLMWWGTLGMILIESTVFALAIVTYFYLRERSCSVAAAWDRSGADVRYVEHPGASSESHPQSMD